MFVDLKGYLTKNGKMSPGDQYSKQLTYKQINNTVDGLLNVTSLQTDNNKFISKVDRMDTTILVAYFARLRDKSLCVLSIVPHRKVCTMPFLLLNPLTLKFII
jgi:hypothetical protein